MLTLRIARRLVHRIGGWLATLPLLVVITFVFTANVALDSQTLTATQEADRQLGTSEAYFVRHQIRLQSGSDAYTRARKTLARAGDGIQPGLVVVDFPLYELAPDGLFYQEMDWSPNSFPEALSVREGRFPAAPGEIALVGDGYDRAVDVGDQLSVLGNRDELTVVGRVENQLNRDRFVIAAPGTWSHLSPPVDPDLQPVAASPIFYLDGPDIEGQLQTVANVLSDRGDDELSDLTEDALLMNLDPVVFTRAEAGVQEPLWTDRSPLSFWAPGLLMVPLTMVVGYLAVMRRLGPSMRLMTRAGVPKMVAVAGAWLSVVVWCAAMTVAGVVLGTLAGHLAAQGGADSWGNPSPTFRAPTPAFIVTMIGLASGAALSWVLLLLRSRNAEEAPTRQQEIRGALSTQQSSLWMRVIRHARHAVATALLCGVIVWLPTMRKPIDGMVLTGLVALLLALIAHDAVLWLVRLLPERRLGDRLTKRLLVAYPRRMSATVILLIVTVALSGGFLTSLAGAIADERETQAATAPPGIVALDNDSTPTKPVPRAVVNAANTVPAIRERTPVQLWSGGHAAYSDGQFTDWKDSLGTLQPRGLILAFESTSDLQRMLEAPLTPAQRRTLTEKGVLISDESVAVEDGAVEVFNQDTKESVASLPAARIDLEPAPWWPGAVGIILTSTTESLGYPMVPGAMFYTGVPQEAAEAVPGALSEAGINPENAQIHRDLPPVLPDFALVISAISLVLLTLVVVGASIRAQVRAMRPWASRLTQLGVSLGWARCIIWQQFGWALLIGVPMGLVAAVLPLTITKLLLPEMNLVIPWTAITVLLVALVGAVGVAAVLAARDLTSKEAIGWTDHGE